MAGYSTLLRDRVSLAARSADRNFLNGYVAQLQTAGWCGTFLQEQRGLGHPSSKAFGEAGKAYENAIRKFAAATAPAVICFAKGGNREEISDCHARHRAGTRRACAHLLLPCAG